nr:40S ribosomal protein SA-like [Meriones unguiculatus]
MSRALDVLQMKEEDVLKVLATGTHLGGTNLDFQMEQHIYKRKSDGVYIINLKRTWEKLLCAAWAIVAIENPADVNFISSRNTGQRAVLKFVVATGATPIAGRFTPGTFTNQIQAAFREPRLLVLPSWQNQAEIGKLKIGDESGTERSGKGQRAQNSHYKVMVSSPFKLDIEAQSGCTFFLSNSAVNISVRSTLGVVVIQCEFMNEHKRPSEEPHGNKFAC